MQLAPGILRTIPSQVAEKSTFNGPLPLVELIQDLQAAEYQPQTLPQSETLAAKAKDVILRHPAWALDFAFKPVRMIEVDVPQPNGAMKRTKVWYMVYRLTNRGQRLAPSEVVDRFGHKTFEPKVAPEPVRTFPIFKLEGLVRDAETQELERKTYMDRIVPLAIPEIQRRERPPTPLLDSVAISREAIPVTPEGEEGGVWGVAMWTDLDPRIDYFSILGEGLTSEYAMEVKGADDYDYRFETLQLNFWRPGDAYAEHENEIRYGVRLVDSPAEQAEILKLYGQTEPLDHRWFFR
ncbi:MAG TPA: hypothetical protein VGN57_10575 [Pirellulaceae bacterium]|nr:hypothetical protein [Pirellulaceae bacterium]